MSFRRWFLPLGIYSPNAHAAGPDWNSICGLWDLARPSVIEDDILRPKCPECLAAVDVLDAVEAGASHASGETEGGSIGSPSPLATPDAP